MKGHEVINHLAQRELPDMEKIREECHRQFAPQGSKSQRKTMLKRFVPVAAAMVMVLTISFTAFGGFGWFAQRFNSPTADVAELPIHEHSMQGTAVMDTSLHLVDSPSITHEVPPPALALDNFWQGIENIVLNPPLDPVDAQPITAEPNIVDIVFVCNTHTTDLRDLVISTPGSFTIPEPASVNLGSSASFHGWRDLHGTLWTAGTLISWETEVSGTLTLTAEWL